MLAEYLGVLIVAVVALVAAARLATRPARSRASSFAPSLSLARRFHQIALLVVSFLVVAVLTLLFAANFDSLGRRGLLVLATFALPLIVGFVYQWRRGALEW